MRPPGARADGDRPSLFVRDPSSRNERWVPTEHSRGPWDDRHCHGGPVSAFLTHACETVDDGSDTDWQVARVTVELTRPVEVGVPLTVHTEVERPGRRVSLVAAHLVADDRTVAMARMLRIARADADLPDHVQVVPEIETPASSSIRATSTWNLSGEELTAYHRDSVEMRFARGGWEDPGPCEVWVRLAVDVVPGERPSPVERVAAAADFGNGVSGALPSPGWIYINPDLTVHLSRPPQGEWIGLASRSLYGVGGSTTGSGLAESFLHDEAGPLGRSVQSLVVTPD